MPAAVLAAIVLLAPGAFAGGSGMRVLIMGDSMMRGVSHSFERAFENRPGVEATAFTSIGSGLARLDLFDWLGKMRDLARDARPDAAVIMMGANDNQPMKTGQGIVRTGTDAWSREYARRVGRAMDILEEAGVSRIYWIGLPDMREEALQADVRKINAIVREQAAERANVTYLDSVPLLSRTPGEYSPYILKSDGMPLPVRAKDGVHLTRKGADYLAEKLVPKILEDH